MYRGLAVTVRSCFVVGRELGKGYGRMAHTRPNLCAQRYPHKLFPHRLLSTKVASKPLESNGDGNNGDLAENTRTVPSFIPKTTLEPKSSILQDLTKAKDTQKHSHVTTASVVNENVTGKKDSGDKDKDIGEKLKAESKDEDATKSIEEYMWKDVLPAKLEDLPGLYTRLAKLRLTGLVVITTMAGYAMAPGTFDLLTFGAVSLGTALTSSSANTINQFLEVPYDSQMNRTKNRPLVRGQLSNLHAMGFAAMSCAAGVGILYTAVNPLTAGLGVFNLVFYTMAYTPMKRLSTANTWVGSVVGAIPPMMGWAAATGALDPGAWLLAGIMFAWQFPHFNALSWNLRPDYSRAGYRMMSVIDPAKCKLVALRYSIGMIALCSLAPVIDLTTWTFAANALPLNTYMAYLAYRFYKDGDSNSSRKLFRFTLIHIPILMTLMLLSKKNYKKRQFGGKDKEAAATTEAALVAKT